MSAQQLTSPDLSGNWQAGMNHFLKAEAEYKRIADLGDDVAQDEACNAYSDARWDLIKMPAPNLPALRWKLDYILEGSHGSLDPYDLGELVQINRDIARLMGGEA